MPKHEYDPDDPMEFVGVALPGDTEEAMVEAFIEEYLWMGFDAERVARMFRNPFYTALHRAYRARGEDWVRERIAAVVRRWSTPERKEENHA
jgi:hypothetical protein